jgi:hypothetical protein
MNQATWRHILRTAVVGTERGPLPAAVSESLGLNVGSDPAQALLEALAAAVLLRKAGHSLVISSFLPAVVSPEASPKEGSPAPSTLHLHPNIAQLPPEILHGRHAALLDEWLSLLVKNGLQIPPEYLPELLDRAERDAVFWEKLLPAVGTRGTWLAAQNPAWQSLYVKPGDEGDWFTSNFKARLRLLAAARRDRPLVALAWLEKTWGEESNDHRVAFLAEMLTGLSLFDEDFLEKTFVAKSREVRRAAAELLAALPESRCCMAWNVLAESCQKFAATPDLTAFLAEKIPDVGAEVPAGLFALTDGKDLRSARQIVLQMLLRLLPPVVWSFESPLSGLVQLQHDPERNFALPALLEATARHDDAAWTEAWLHFLHERPEHPLWRSTHLFRLLTDLNDSLRDIWLPKFCQHLDVLASPESVLYRVLTSGNRPCLPRLTHAVLAFWEAAARRPFAYPTPQLRAVLDQAARHCQPADAESTYAWLLPDDPATRLPQHWQQGLDALVDVVRFRRKMAQSMHRETPVLPVQ